MLHWAVANLHRLRLACLLLLTLAALAPALEAHACVDADCAPAVLAFDTAEDDRPRADCGPACANGCCHAPHVATTPDFAAVPQPPSYASTPAWSDAVAPPPADMSGPRRPPRA